MPGQRQRKDKILKMSLVQGYRYCNHLSFKIPFCILTLIPSVDTTLNYERPVSFRTLNNSSRSTCESRCLEDRQGDLGFQGSPCCPARTCLRIANNNTKPHNTNVLAEDTDYATLSLFSWELPVTCATVTDVKKSIEAV